MPSGCCRNEGHGCPPDIATMSAMGALQILPQCGPWVLSGYCHNEGHGCPPDIAAMRAMGALREGATMKASCESVRLSE